ncbi:MAG: gamma-glutamyl-gamma-aminobutyrate hydrolase family protein [Anaerolineae bacterium]|nr:gamma-glutamyl-gamma-aminobutyrate hydrolase family protein [Anaerolineae bacterium]
MKPLIGIPCYQDKPPQEIRTRYTLHQNYINALAAAGAAPILLPLTLDEAANQTIFDRLDAIVLAGGEDVNPACYGQSPHPKTEVPDPDRDRLEISLTRWAVERHKPLMAICRGIQLLNVAMGGTLIQDIADCVPGALHHTYPYDEPTLRGKPTHEVTIESGSCLSTVFGTRANTNSFHHQALADVPGDFRVVARTSDGIVEAIERQNGSLIFGVQWHPEDMYDTDESMLNLFRMFVANIG